MPEPDGLSTSLLGPPVVNCVLDLPPFEGWCTPDPVPLVSGSLGSVIAPGCTGANAQRRLDGQCGLWTVGAAGELAGLLPPPVSEQGMPGNAAPGAYTPTRGHAVRFLDGRITTGLDLPGVPGLQLEANRHLQELKRLTGLDIPGSRNVLPGQTIAWAWYGQWKDLNGNGVVDHATPGTAGPTQNEFRWLGGCRGLDGARHSETIAQELCLEDGNPHAVPPGQACLDPGSRQPCAGTTLHAWFFPGNHHARGAATDPGQQVATYGLRLGNCSAPPTCDEVEAASAGDPLLGAQDSVRPDLTFRDFTGDPQDIMRQWLGSGAVDSDEASGPSVGGPPAVDPGAPLFPGGPPPTPPPPGNDPTFYGDDGLLVTFTQAYGVNCAPGSSSTVFDLGRCTFLDVDRQRTVNQDVEALLVGWPGEYPNGGLKGTSRSAWLLVRDGVVFDPDPAVRKVESVLGNNDVYLVSQGPVQGTVDDLAMNPGWSREPNTPQDLYPGVRYRACRDLPAGDPRSGSLEAQHRGWCNTDDSGGGPAYGAYRRQARGFTDAQALREAPLDAHAFAAGQCVPCLTWGPATVPVQGESLDLSAEDHARTLGPGVYSFRGRLGAWRDASHWMDESLFPDPPGTRRVAYSPDGWVGMAPRATGQWQYRNFLPTTCSTDEDLAGSSSVHEAAECNPYLDGNVEDPQDYTSVGRAAEWSGRCNDQGLRFALRPADGYLDTQILVWRNYGHGVEVGLVSLGVEIVPYGPGPVGPLELPIVCDGAGGAYATTDLIFWLEGNRGDAIVTTLEATATIDDLDGDGWLDGDRLRDVDVYAPVL